MHESEQDENTPTGHDDTTWSIADLALRAPSLITPPTRPTILCSWCQVEGTRTVLREGDETAPPSHGICERHQRALLEHAGICVDDLT